MPTTICGIAGKKRRIIAALRDGYPAAWVARQVGISRAELYRWRAEDPEFAQAWEEAIFEGNDLLEDEAWRRGVDGYNERPIFNRKGEIVATIKDYSDKLLMLLLRVRNPKVFNPKSGDDSKNTPVINNLPSATTLQEATAMYQAMLRGETLQIEHQKTAGEDVANPEDTAVPIR